MAFSSRFAFWEQKGSLSHVFLRPAFGSRCRMLLSGSPSLPSASTVFGAVLPASHCAEQRGSCPVPHRSAAAVTGAVTRAITNAITNDCFASGGCSP